MTKYVCDRCGEEITDKRLPVYDDYFPMNNYNAMANARQVRVFSGVMRAPHNEMVGPDIVIASSKGDFCVDCLTEMLKRYKPFTENSNL